MARPPERRQHQPPEGPLHLLPALQNPSTPSLKHSLGKEVAHWLGLEGMSITESLPGIDPTALLQGKFQESSGGWGYMAGLETLPKY